MQGDYCDKSNKSIILLLLKPLVVYDLSKTAPLKLRISTSKNRNVAYKLNKSTNRKSKSYDQTQQDEAPIRFHSNANEIITLTCDFLWSFGQVTNLTD